MAKTPWQYLGCKSHCWKAHFFKICFFIKYFHQRLLSLVNKGLHAAIIWLSPLIHEGEQRYKPYIVSDPRMVSLLTPPLKNPGYAPSISMYTSIYWPGCKENPFYSAWHSGKLKLALILLAQTSFQLAQKTFFDEQNWFHSSSIIRIPQKTSLARRAR